MLLLYTSYMAEFGIVDMTFFFFFFQFYLNDKFSFWFQLQLIFSEVRIEGLETLDYFENLKERERFTEQGDAITFESEVSRSVVFDRLPLRFEL